MIYLNVFRLSNDVELPTYGTSLANCFDLSFQPTSNVVHGYDAFNSPVEYNVSTLNGMLSIYPGDRLLIPTGLIFKIDHHKTIETYADISRTELPLQNHSIRLHPRSGLSLKKGLILANCEGIVDVDYQEEVFVLLTNVSKMHTTIRKGDRIAQGEIVCNEPFHITIVNTRPRKHSERSGGFGSTGIQLPTVEKYPLSTETPPMEEWVVDGPTRF
jgi:dUTP pyrophosphatase